MRFVWFGVRRRAGVGQTVGQGGAGLVVGLGGVHRIGQTLLLGAAEMVVNRVLQDALEQHRQLGDRLRRIVFSELEHRVLHDVERHLFVPDGEHRLLERSALDLCQKGRQFLCRSQVSVPEMALDAIERL